MKLATACRTLSEIVACRTPLIAPCLGIPSANCAARGEMELISWKEAKGFCGETAPERIILHKTQEVKEEGGCAAICAALEMIAGIGNGPPVAPP